jgi:hypothetical protein
MDVVCQQAVAAAVELLEWIMERLPADQHVKVSTRIVPYIPWHRAATPKTAHAQDTRRYWNVIFILE